MAGNDQGDGIGAASTADSTGGPWRAKEQSQFAVGYCAAERNLTQVMPDDALELGVDREVERRKEVRHTG